jgi:hypothetical protein
LDNAAGGEKERPNKLEQPITPHAHSVTVCVNQTNPQAPSQQSQPKETKKHTTLEKLPVFIAVLAFGAAFGQWWVTWDTEIIGNRAICTRFCSRGQP